ncbi:MAG TPA: ABC transporter substrate-binding protein, partial [Herpetosiphonaceae bacterium]|nr:ABC transporter substrate-binding protein [Herpetosiphonaceae bacterium]
PTLVLSVDEPGYWRQTLLDIARLVDRTPQAEQFLSEYDATVTRLAAQTAPVVKESPNVLLVYSFAAADGTMILGNDWYGSQPFTQLGFTVLEPEGVTFANGVAPTSPEIVAQTEADIVFVLRPELADGTRPTYPIDAILESRKDTKVVYQVFGSTRASTAPWTDRFVLEEVATLLAPAGGQDSPAPAAGAFPVTVKHKYGSTTVETKPERIVTVGLTDHDALLALGIAPVGVTEWFGGYPYATWEWAKDELGDAKPEIVGDGSGANFEKIAALKPDLILALYSGLTQENYDLLSKIAPTVAQPGEYVDYGIPWQELTRTVGTVVGQPEQADALVRDVEARFEQARKDHPEFAGATALVATPYEGIWIYGPEDVRGRLLTALGFNLPADLAEVTGTQFGGNLSMERADMLDVDAIIWLDAESASGPLGGPVYASLNVHTQGREVFLKSTDDPLGGATSFVSVLSLPFLLDGLLPKLATAIDGDPATAVQ